MTSRLVEEEASCRIEYVGKLSMKALIVPYTCINVSSIKEENDDDEHFDEYKYRPYRVALFRRIKSPDDYHPFITIPTALYCSLVDIRLDR